MIFKFLNWLTYPDGRLLKTIKLARFKPMQEQRLATSLDALSVILKQKDSPISRQLDRIALTPEILESTISDFHCESLPATTNSFLVRLNPFSRPSPYSEDFSLALKKAHVHCVQKGRRMISQEDFVWGIMEVNDPKLELVLASLNITVADVQAMLEISD